MFCSEDTAFIVRTVPTCVVEKTRQHYEYFGLDIMKMSEEEKLAELKKVLVRFCPDLIEKEIISPTELPSYCDLEEEGLKAVEEVVDQPTTSKSSSRGWLIYKN